MYSGLRGRFGHELRLRHVRRHELRLHRNPVARLLPFRSSSGDLSRRIRRLLSRVLPDVHDPSILRKEVRAILTVRRFDPAVLARKALGETFEPPSKRRPGGVRMSPLEVIKLDQLMDRSTGRGEVQIGLIDGPVVLDHPDLSGATIHAIAGTTGGACIQARSAACQLPIGTPMRCTRWGLLRARRQRPCRRDTEQRAQGGWQVLGPVLNRSESNRGRSNPPVLDQNHSTSQRGSRLLHCRISTYLMTAKGQTRTSSLEVACLLSPAADKPAASGRAAMCHRTKPLAR